jgi:hypothetical protein
MLLVFLPLPTTSASTKHALSNFSTVKCKVSLYCDFSFKSRVFAFALHDEVWKKTVIAK